jgi:protein required for attachment to host cells
MLIAHDALIMALDGARMSLFQNKGSVRDPVLELLAEEERKTPSTAELGDDQPGRAFQSSGIGRGAYEMTDLHQQGEDEFTLKMVELLIFHMKNNDRKTIMIAPPHVLGLMRKHLPDEIRKRSLAEIDKDYAGRTALEVAELLDKHEA